MNMRIAIHLFADDPIIITASSASSDQGEALNYVPGATLWGALAARVYSKCQQNSWELFHSGTLKITNAYPVLKNGAVAWPVPLCLHYAKGERALLDKAVCAASGKLGDASQPKQFRGGFVSNASNRIQNPRMQDAIKTAINPETGAAAEAQLFASEAISAGQSFVFWLEGPKSLVEMAHHGLGQKCFLGRSRSAEFGKSTLTRTNLPDWPQGKHLTDETAYVWALSDLCLSDDHGQPLLDPKWLTGPIRGKVNRAHSFLRFRTYWPYNAKWQSRALARQVIEQGSVFRLDNARGTNDFSWIGEENGSGCGLVYVSDRPPLEALRAMPEFLVATNTAPTTVGSSRLAGWLSDRAAAQLARENAMSAAAELSDQMLKMLENARMHPANQGDGPTKTQLSRLRNGIASRSADWMADLWGNETPEPGKGRSEAENDPAWGFLVVPEEKSKLKPFFQWVKSEIMERDGKVGETDAFIKAVELAAKKLDDPEGGK